MVKFVVVALAVLAVWFLVPHWLPFLRACPLVAYGQPISYAAVLAGLVGYLGWRHK